MAVFVTDGDQRSTLAVVRSLGRAGIAVTVGEGSTSSLAGSSRYCSARLRYPSPAEDAPGFQAFLREISQSGRFQLLLPMTDITTQLVASARDSLPPEVCIPFPGTATIMLVQDKWRMLELARQEGIPCPQTRILREDENLDEVAANLQYPVVIKPRFSRVLREGHWVFGSVQYASDPASMAAKYRSAHAMIPHPMLQENIEGEGRGVFLLMWQGELKAAFCHRRLREKPPWGGVSVYSESVPLDQHLVSSSAALLKAVGWQGIAMVEFKTDLRDQCARLMEVNGRFWGSLQLAVDAGIDFPLLLYRCAMGEEVATQFEYRAGVKSRWLLGDLDNLLIRLRTSQYPSGTTYSLGSRISAALSFMRFYESDLQYDVLRLDDPRPGWFEVKSYVGDHARKLLCHRPRSLSTKGRE